VVALRVAVRLPNHLGDTLMAWPALEALATRHEVTLYGPAGLRPFWSHGPWRDPGPIPAGAHDAAVLLAPSLRAAWEARRVPRRIGTPTDHRRWLLTDVVEEARHRRDTYAALARRLGVEPAGPPRLARAVARGGPAHIGLNPIVKGGWTRRWTGFRALADALAPRVPVRFYAGPGEEAELTAIAGPHRCEAGLPLEAFARALGDCRGFVSGDSGAAHFAAALGTPTLVLYGSTAPERTGPAGALAIRGSQPTCAPCYANRCLVPPQRCLDIAVRDVLAAVESMWAR